MSLYCLGKIYFFQSFSLSKSLNQSNYNWPLSPRCLYKSWDLVQFTSPLKKYSPAINTDLTQIIASVEMTMNQVKLRK
jgi:hypothetical protein